jgi:hypothetical protein
MSRRHCIHRRLAVDAVALLIRESASPGTDNKEALHRRGNGTGRGFIGEQLERRDDASSNTHMPVASTKFAGGSAVHGHGAVWKCRGVARAQRLTRWTVPVADHSCRIWKF